jgi:hypothetical protein
MSSSASKARPIVAVAIALVVFGSAGCNRGPALYAVHGKVVYPDGTPMKGGTMTCELADNSQKMMSRATINMEDGTFTIMTFKEGDGVPPGKYRALVLGRRNDPKKETIDPEIIGQVHPRYSSYDTSGLEFTVEPSANNEVVLKIERGPKQ